MVLEVRTRESPCKTESVCCYFSAKVRADNLELYKSSVRRRFADWSIFPLGCERSTDFLAVFAESRARAATERFRESGQWNALLIITYYAFTSCRDPLNMDHSLHDAGV